MIKILPYKQGDGLKINPNPKAFPKFTKDNFLSRINAAYYINSDLKVYTVYEDNKPIAIICWYELWSGVAELIALIDESVDQVGVPFARAMKKLIDNEISLHNLVRVQTTLRSTYQEGGHWLSFLGMDKEGTLRSFCEDGADCEIWARVEA